MTNPAVNSFRGAPTANGHDRDHKQEYDAAHFQPLATLLHTLIAVLAIALVALGVYLGCVHSVYKRVTARQRFREQRRERKKAAAAADELARRKEAVFAQYLKGNVVLRGQEKEINNAEQEGHAFSYDQMMQDRLRPGAPEGRPSACPATPTSSQVVPAQHQQMMHPAAPWSQHVSSSTGPQEQHGVGDAFVNRNPGLHPNEVHFENCVVTMRPNDPAQHAGLYTTPLVDQGHGAQQHPHAQHPSGAQHPAGASVWRTMEENFGKVMQKVMSAVAPGPAPAPAAGNGGSSNQLAQSTAIGAPSLRSRPAVTQEVVGISAADRREQKVVKTPASHTRCHAPSRSTGTAGVEAKAKQPEPLRTQEFVLSLGGAEPAREAACSQRKVVGKEDVTSGDPAASELKYLQDAANPVDFSKFMNEAALENLVSAPNGAYAHWQQPKGREAYVSLVQNFKGFSPAIRHHAAQEAEKAVSRYDEIRKTDGVDKAKKYQQFVLMVQILTQRLYVADLVKRGTPVLVRNQTASTEGEDGPSGSGGREQEELEDPWHDDINDGPPAEDYFIQDAAGASSAAGGAAGKIPVAKRKERQRLLWKQVTEKLKHLKPVESASSQDPNDWHVLNKDHLYFLFFNRSEAMAVALLEALERWDQVQPSARGEPNDLRYHHLALPPPLKVEDDEGATQQPDFLLHLVLKNKKPDLNLISNRKTKLLEELLRDLRTVLADPRDFTRLIDPNEKKYLKWLLTKKHNGAPAAVLEELDRFEQQLLVWQYVTIALAALLAVVAAAGTAWTCCLWRRRKALHARLAERREKKAANYRRYKEGQSRRSLNYISGTSAAKPKEGQLHGPKNGARIADPSSKAYVEKKRPNTRKAAGYGLTYDRGGTVKRPLLGGPPSTSVPTRGVGGSGAPPPRGRSGNTSAADGDGYKTPSYGSGGAAEIGAAWHGPRMNSSSPPAGHSPGQQTPPGATPAPAQEHPQQSPPPAPPALLGGLPGEQVQVVDPLVNSEDDSFFVHQQQAFLGFDQSRVGGVNPALEDHDLSASYVKPPPRQHQTPASAPPPAPAALLVDLPQQHASEADYSAEAEEQTVRATAPPPPPHPTISALYSVGRPPADPVPPTSQSGGASGGGSGTGSGRASRPPAASLYTLFEAGAEEQFLNQQALLGYQPGDHMQLSPAEHQREGAAETEQVEDEEEERTH
eukprot:g9682.t1